MYVYNFLQWKTYFKSPLTLGWVYFINCFSSPLALIPFYPTTSNFIITTVLSITCTQILMLAIIVTMKSYNLVSYLHISC